MTEFTSDVQTIPHDQAKIFAVLSDLNNLDNFKSQLPPSTIKELSYDTDSCRFKVERVGAIALRIVERTAPKTIKLASETSPVPFTCWIQLVGDAENTHLKLTLRADIPLLLRPMITKPLEKGLKEAAAFLAALPY